MPWQNDGNGERPNPWGSGPRRGGGGGEPPQIDDIIRKGQEQIRNALPGGKGGFVIVLLVAFCLWLASGIYRVETNEQGVVLLFGKWIESTSPGLHWHMPYPIESAEVRAVTDERQISIGGGDNNSRTDESLMLTGDENIVSVRFNVVWKIKDLGQYLFNIKQPEQTVKAVSESVMREIVGATDITTIITKGRDRLGPEARDLIQKTLDAYEAGIEIVRVPIRDTAPPAEVKDAFLDVQRAAADQQRYRNQAEAYRNKVVNEAQGNAEQTVQQAEAYKAQTIARAEGEAARFKDVYDQYALAKDVTKKRLYLETMEEVLSGMHKVILDTKSGAVTYLPLGDMLKKQGGEK